MIDHQLTAKTLRALSGEKVQRLLSEVKSWDRHGTKIGYDLFVHLAY